MYDVVLWEKGFIAQSVAALRVKIESAGDKEALRLLEHLTGKKNEIAKLASAPQESDPEKQAIRRAETERLENEANDLEKSLVMRSTALGEEKRMARATWQQVRDALKPEEAAVEIVRFPFFDGKAWTGTSYYVALVLRHGRAGPEFVVLGEQKELERLPLADYRRLVAEPEKDRPESLGRRFYTAFWQPLEAKLGDAKRIYISPDGELNQVSLGAVPGRDGRMLMEAYELRTVNSTKDLLRSASSPASGAVVLIGNPKFDLSEAELRAELELARTDDKGFGAPQMTPGAATRGAASLRSRDLHGGALEELTGTGQEIDDVSAAVKRKGWQVMTYTGQEALEERVKAVRRPRVLHLATHGFFEADQPRQLSERGEGVRSLKVEDPMLRSGLYLAGANRTLLGGASAPDLDDGVLTAYEASQLNLLGTELVVLSACETGLGKTEAGEGVFGLRRAFQVAGAEAVLMSLWAVPDEETRELMALFYGKWLAGIGKHEALREAQLEMREKVKTRYGEDLPLFWGAFVLVGR
jgi:CHAT domain-containing protein